MAAFNTNLKESNRIATSVTQYGLKTKKQVHKCDPDGVPWMLLSDQEKAFYYFIQSLPLIINLFITI